MPARLDGLGMNRQTAYYACQICLAKAVVVKMKKKNKDDEMEEARTKMVWPACTMNKPKRTLQVMQETSDAARDDPNINPQENYGQKGNNNSIQ